MQLLNLVFTVACLKTNQKVWPAFSSHTLVTCSAFFGTPHAHIFLMNAFNATLQLPRWKLFVVWHSKNWLGKETFLPFCCNNCFHTKSKHTALDHKLQNAWLCLAYLRDYFKIRVIFLFLLESWVILHRF